MILFLPKYVSFGGNVNAGTGTVVQGTYTVPAQRRAILYQCYIRVLNAAGAAANTIELFVDIIPVAPVVSFRIMSLYVGATATIINSSYHTECDLIAGDQVRVVSVNTSAVNCTGVIMQALIREYQ